MNMKRKNLLVAWSFILPNFLGFAIFTLIPMLFSFALAFMAWDAFSTPEFIGLDNFRRLIGDENVRIAIRNTIYYTVGNVPLTMIASLALALLLNRKMRGVKFFRAAFFFPFITSLVAVAVVWNMLLHPTMGPVNNILRSLGMTDPPRWTASTTWAMPAIIIASVWRGMGYYMVLYLAGLQAIPKTLYEAAQVDGATKWKQFIHVTLPMLRPTTFFVTIMLTISSFRVFDLVEVMTGGGPGRATTVLVTQIYNEAFLRFNFGYASAISLVLFVLVMVITIVQFTIEKKFGADY